MGQSRSFLSSSLYNLKNTSGAIAYTVPGMRNWLQRHGFSYKKPTIIPGKAYEPQQREWLAKNTRN